MSTRPDHPLLQRPLYIFDLPREIATTLSFDSNSSQSISSTSTLDTSDFLPATNPIPNEVHDNRVSNTNNNSVLERSQSISPETIAQGTATCTLCNQSFSNVSEQRTHHRSDLHNYNLKQRIKGLSPVNEADFERLIGELDESISGSDSDESSDDDATQRKDTTLSALLKKQAKISSSDNEQMTSMNAKRKRGAGRDPILWFKSASLPLNVNLGVYRQIFSTTEQTLDPSALVQIIQSKQLKPTAPTKTTQEVSIDDQEGGVPLPASMLTPSTSGPHYFLCMMGGGHFAAMIISLSPKTIRKNGIEDRSATVIAHKTFHRYTTRRKQGGSQSANDNAKGAAHSAGSTLRRYNETALTTDIRQLLQEWKTLVQSSELWFVRATGSTNRRTLYGPYEGQVMTHTDDRIRGFPFNTRRATQAELMRAFVELTRVKVVQVDQEALARQREEERLATGAAAARAISDAQAADDARVAARAQKEQDRKDQEAVLHTSQLQALIRRSKAPGLISYLSSNNLDANYRFAPQSLAANHHTPFSLHLAASMNSAVCVTALLNKTNADPTLVNSAGKTAFEICGDRSTRDAFRVARHELGETKHDWTAAKIPAAMTREEAGSRAEREKADAAEAKQKADAEAEAERKRIDAEELANGATPNLAFKSGKAKSLLSSNEKTKTAQEKRDDETRGMTDAMKARLEREKRARAAEARLGMR